MRIALVQDHLRMGGTESQSVALANAFAAAGQPVLLVTFRPGGPLEARLEAPVRRVALQRRDLGLDWFAPRLLATLRPFRPDVVQVMGRMANAHGWRVIRGLPAARIVATFRTGKRIPRLYRATLRRAHAVVANSDEAARRLGDHHGVVGPRVQVIRNALVERPDAPAPGAREAVRAAIGAPPQGLVLLCTAMMRPGKGHRELVDICARLDPARSWELWLAGEGVERAACEKRASRRGLAGRVRFLGRRADTNRLYAAADLAVLASRVESLPNFLVEAQWNGLPAVAYDTAGVGETFVPGKSGFLIPSGDEEGFAAAVARLGADPVLRAAMAAAGRAYARAEFDPGRQNRRYLDLYAAITKSTPSA